MKTRKTKTVIKAPETWEEYVIEAKESFELHGRRSICPEVNYFFKVGESVTLGGLNDCRIEEILEDGMILLISYHDTGKTYGKPFDYGRKPMYTYWFEIDPKDAIQNTSFGRERMNTQNRQTVLHGFISELYRRGMIDSPEYQRDYVWTIVDKQRLVRSIFDRADIGKFVTMSHPYPENRIEIIDGKQRIRAIMDFMEGRFDYNGYTWFQLSWLDKFIFQDQIVQVTELQSDYVKKSDVLWLFLMVNRGGVPQTDEQLSKVQKLYDEAVQEEMEEAATAMHE